MGRDTLSYVIYYTDGSQRIESFESEIGFLTFIHNEGDHVRSYKSFYPDEQHEEDYLKKKADQSLDNWKRVDVI